MTGHYLLKQGFLGTAAPLYADVVLLLEVTMAMTLLIGGWLARRRKYQWHARCQCAIVLFNLIVVATAMVPAFRARVLPKIPARLGKGYYLISSTHAVLGILAEGAGLYILVAAGTQALPVRFRLTNYKLWMRSTLALWWMALLFGIATYARWYIP